MSQPINRPAFITLTCQVRGKVVISASSIVYASKSIAPESVGKTEVRSRFHRDSVTYVYHVEETPEQIFAMLEPKQFYALPEPGDARAEREEQKKFMAYWMSEIREAIRSINDKHQF